MMALAPPAIPKPLPRLHCLPKNTSARVRVIPTEQKQCADSLEGANNPQQCRVGPIKCGEEGTPWTTIC